MFILLALFCETKHSINIDCRLINIVFKFKTFLIDVLVLTPFYYVLSFFNLEIFRYCTYSLFIPAVFFILS